MKLFIGRECPLCKPLHGLTTETVEGLSVFVLPAGPPESEREAAALSEADLEDVFELPLLITDEAQRIAGADAILKRLGSEGGQP